MKGIFASENKEIVLRTVFADVIKLKEISEGRYLQNPLITPLFSSFHSHVCYELH